VDCSKQALRIDPQCPAYAAADPTTTRHTRSSHSCLGLNWPVMKLGVSNFPPLGFRALSIVLGVPVLGLDWY
jgi:hypothetical protein